MPTLYVATQDVLLILREAANKWTLEEHLRGNTLQCVAVDPADSGW